MAEQSIPSLTAFQPTVFALPGLLPAQSRLYVDASSRTLTLVAQQEAASAHLIRTHQVSPAELKALLALLQAYPRVCSYQALAQAFFPDAGVSQGTLAARPIRRAINALQPVLLAFGLRVCAQRAHGYFLVSAGPLASMPEDGCPSSLLMSNLPERRSSST